MTKCSVERQMTEREQCHTCQQLWPEYIQSTSEHGDLQQKLHAAKATAARHAETVGNLSWQMETVIRRIELARDSIRKHEAEAHAEAQSAGQA
jgi:hypothetical protein